jgi:hypothetical protein
MTTPTFPDSPTENTREVWQVAENDASFVLGASSSGQERGRSGRPRGGLILAACGMVLLSMLGLIGGGAYVLTESIGDNVNRVPDVFGPLEDAPRPPAPDTLTVLLVGTDSRSPSPTT